MSTTHDTSDPALAHRTLAIEVLFGDLATCKPCLGTLVNAEIALGALADVLGATGRPLEVRRIHVQSAEHARELGFVTSPTIRVNGRDIDAHPPFGGCGCGEGDCGCASGMSCRSWRHRGVQYDEAPVGLIVDAVLSEIYRGTTA
jgi:hypothetical protein